MRSAGHCCLACDLPGRDWLYESLELDFTEIEILELRSSDRLCAIRDNDGAGLRERLQPGGKIRGIAEDAMLLGNRAFRHIADQRDARCDTDARAQLFLRGQGGDRLHQCEAGVNGALRVVFVCVRIAKICHRTVAMMSRDKAVEAGNGFSNTAPVVGDDGAEVFRIEPRGERSRSDQVAKQYRKLPALDRARVPGRRCRCGRIHAQSGSAVAAKLVQGRVCRAAGQTAPHHRRSALSAKFSLLRDFGCAIRAVHPDLNGYQ
nr:hypothetical protein [Bradyrhizobium algeriense]